MTASAMALRLIAEQLRHLGDQGTPLTAENVDRQADRIDRIANSIESRVQSYDFEVRQLRSIIETHGSDDAKRRLRDLDNPGGGT